MPIKVDSVGLGVGMEAAIWEGLKERAIDIFDELVAQEAPISRTVLHPIHCSGDLTHVTIKLERGSEHAWFLGPGALVSCYPPKWSDRSVPLLQMVSPAFDIRRAKEVEIAAKILLQIQDANLMAMLNYSRIMADVPGSDALRFVLEDTDITGLWEDVNDLLESEELGNTWGMVCHPDLANHVRTVTGRATRHLETSTGMLKTFETRLIPQVIGGRRVDTVYLIREGRPGNIAVGPVRLAFLDEDELKGAIFVQRAGFAVVDDTMICILDAYHRE